MYEKYFGKFPKSAKYIKPERFIGWFFIIFIPIAIILSLLIHWHNSIVGEPTLVHLILRSIACIFLFGLGMIFFYWKVFLPAIRKADKEKEIEDSRK